MRHIDNVLVSCYRNYDIGYLNGILELHYIVAVHKGFECFYRINFTDNNACTHSTCAHSYTTTTPAVASRFTSTLASLPNWSMASLYTWMLLSSPAMNSS